MPELSSLLFRKVSLPEYLPGSLFLHPMPGKYEDIATFEHELKKRNINYIICLPDMDEIAEVSPQYLTYIHKPDREISIECFPISDFGVPEHPEKFLILAKKSSELLIKGESLLVHCRMGIGRTGLFAVILLMTAGVCRVDAEHIIRNAGAGAQTYAQKQIIYWADDHLNEPEKK